jgi:hypothetical protein
VAQDSEEYGMHCHESHGLDLPRTTRRRSLTLALAAGAVAGLGTLSTTGNGRTAVARQDEDAHPAIVALTTVLADAAAVLGMPAAEIAVLSLEAREWPDGCLGLGHSGEGCTDAITPGYRIALGPPADGLIYRTDLRGAFRREPEGAAGTPLRIHYEITGGIDGVDEEIDFDATTLSASELEALRQLLDAADFWNLPRELDNGEPFVDGFEYVVSATEGSRQHTVSTYDGSGDGQTRYPGVWRLLQWLSDRSWEELFD